MSDPSPTLPELHAKLDRLQATVEGTQRKAWVDYFCAVLLSLTTIASAWCAYQSSRWSGVQTFRLAAANKASRDAMAHEGNAQMWKSFDAQMLTAFVEAKFRGDDKYSEFLRNRFRPEARGAVEAWLTQNPLTNPAALKHPFAQPEYREPDRRLAEALTAESAHLMDRAGEANHTSDRYVMLTVLFATVLFFAGISGSMHSRLLRRILMYVGVVVFAFTLISLAGLPHCND